MAKGELEDLSRRAVSAARVLATTGTAAKDAALRLTADLLEEHSHDVLEANDSDVRSAEAAGTGATALDRLRLSSPRIAAMAAGLRQVASLADPVGEVVEGSVRPNGLRVSRVRVPLGVVGIIYENRPNVTSDAAGLCLKAGNATMLRGSSSALESNRAVVRLLRQALSKVGLPEDAVVLVEDVSHEAAVDFMQLEAVDCLIPRGGHSLLESVRRNATVPVVIDGDGNCHVYVDASADLDKAIDIVVNAKTQRPGVCNAAESLLVHRAVAAAFLPRAAGALAEVELVGDEAARAVVPGMGMATEADYATEFLGLKLAVAVVDDLDGAIAHIARFGSGHSEAIVTTDLPSAERFCR
ncbi:MAG TPA: glutamate-5-semialdehyde dehydrogenase, partial [Acidimicrobiales bacterium]|nr:glutamate-5-semialdehyde dehydrogenase [Acidimicrobiales bacterium]